MAYAAGIVGFIFGGTASAAVLARFRLDQKDVCFLARNTHA